MCGIAGVLGAIDETGARDAVELMLAAMVHRGPDDGDLTSFCLPSGVVALGARRLAVLDRSPTGNQPMAHPSTGHTLAYNGEIYNHRSLARELEGAGAVFRGHSDTEVLLHAYARWGPECVERINGMFAFAVWDPIRRHLFLARDRIGMKPLYWTRTGGRFFFASEMRALLAGSGVPRSVDPAGVDSYLAYGAAQDPLTIVAGVAKLPPAHTMTADIDGVSSPRRYWHAPFGPKDSPVLDDAHVRTRTRELLEQSVTDHLVSDAPVGFYLSGGLDSTALVALAARVKNEPFRTFTMQFEEPRYAEGRYARLAATRYGTEHHEIVISQRIVATHLGDMLDAFDQPTNLGIPWYVISKFAREHAITVALSGQGGDEVFGGYQTFRTIPMHRRSRLRKWAAAATAGGLFWSPRLRSSARLGRWRTGGDVFAAYRVERGAVPSPLRRSLVRSPLSPDVVDGSPRTEHEELVETLGGLHPFDQVSALEVRKHLGNRLVMHCDNMSMAHSIELRFPLLDQRLVEHVAAIPGPQKVAAGVDKPVLARALGEDIPAEIAARRKQALTLPYASWLRGELSDPVAGRLCDAAAAEQIGLDARAVRRVWEDYAARRRATSAHAAWVLFVLIDWCERNGVRGVGPARALS